MLLYEVGCLDMFLELQMKRITSLCIEREREED